jgi:hypothetical protein
MFFTQVEDVATTTITHDPFFTVQLPLTWLCVPH